MVTTALAAAAVSVTHTQQAEVFQSYQQEIPNGDKVVRNGVAWPGVGHENSAGGGQGIGLNPFGTDFQQFERKWGPVFCQEDSDEDGQTNGMELGDPECVWTKGDTPARTTDISHPGYADSMTTAGAGGAEAGGAEAGGAEAGGAEAGGAEAGGAEAGGAEAGGAVRVRVNRLPTESQPTEEGAGGGEDGTVNSSGSTTTTSTTTGGQSDGGDGAGEEGGGDGSVPTEHHERYCLFRRYRILMASVNSRSLSRSKI